jgi:hypothetical protein
MRIHTSQVRLALLFAMAALGASAVGAILRLQDQSLRMGYLATLAVCAASFSSSAQMCSITSVSGRSCSVK